MITVDRAGLEKIKEMASLMCDDYCYYPVKATTEDIAQTICVNCPLVKLLADELTLDTMREGD